MTERAKPTHDAGAGVTERDEHDRDEGPARHTLVVVTGVSGGGRSTVARARRTSASTSSTNLPQA